MPLKTSRGGRRFNNLPERTVKTTRENPSHHQKLLYFGKEDATSRFQKAFSLGEAVLELKRLLPPTFLADAWAKRDLGLTL